MTGEDPHKLREMGGTVYLDILLFILVYIIEKFGNE